MGVTEYGYFAFGLSLATILAIGANFGQQTAILRYWPEEMVAGRPDEGARGAARRRRGHADGGLADHAGAAGRVEPLAPAMCGSPLAHLYAAAALILPLALAEYWSSALRAQGSVWTGARCRATSSGAPRCRWWWSGSTTARRAAQRAAAALLLTALVLALSLGAADRPRARPPLRDRAGHSRAFRAYWARAWQGEPLVLPRHRARQRRAQCRHHLRRPAGRAGRRRHLFQRLPHRRAADAVHVRHHSW